MFLSTASTYNKTMNTGCLHVVMDSFHGESVQMSQYFLNFILGILCSLHLNCQRHLDL